MYLGLIRSNKVRKVKIHNNKLAINVKCLEVPKYPDLLEDGWPENYDLEETFLKNELFEKIEKTLNEFYPELHCEVNVAGRSDEWLELEGFWSVEKVDAKHGGYTGNCNGTQDLAVYDCIEMFEFLVNASIGIWYQFWQNIIDKIVLEGKQQ
jgi:hypothetical protein